MTKYGVLLDAIRECWTDGHPPTYRGLCRRTGIGSTSTVARYVERLRGDNEVIVIQPEDGGNPIIWLPDILQAVRNTVDS